VTVINVYVGNLKAVGHYRMIWPAAAVALAQTDHEVNIIGPFDDEWDLGLNESKNGRISFERPPECDVVVIQNPVVKQLSQTVTGLKQLGYGVVVDVDDNYRHVDPDNFYSQKQKEMPDILDWKYLANAVAKADVFTCTTPAIQRLHGRNAHVIPNYVPKAWLGISRQVKREPAVGWTGSLLTKTHDLPVVGDGVRKALDAHGITQFVSVGPHDVADLVGCGDLYHYNTGPVDLADFPQVLVDHIDVGIIPLEATNFNDCKSWITGLIMATLGIPFVASMTAEYWHLSTNHNIGILALDTDDSWRRGLELILKDPWAVGWENRMQVVAHRLTIEDHAEDWLNAWLQAAERRNKK
jgi:hypothetical protein